MALLTRLKAKTDVSNTDITRNLPSLQFESAIDDEDKQLLLLRARSHATTVLLCAQATYFVDILNEGRQMKTQVKSPQKRTARILQDLNNRDPLLVGIIGCGHLGSQLAHCLLTYGRLNPSELQISTRRPETLGQLSAVADEIKDYLSPSTIIYCTASTTTPRKLKQMFGIDSILKPECVIEVGNEDKPWDCSVNIGTALENRDIIEKTNPFALDKSDCIVSTSSQFGVVLIFAFVNMCSAMGLGRRETLDALHLVVFGETDKDPIDDRLRVEHFTRHVEENSEKVFPRFDLVRLSEVTTAVLKKMTESEELRHTFASRYWEVFEHYVHLKAYGQV